MKRTIQTLRNRLTLGAYAALVVAGLLVDAIREWRRQ
jgi:hypothetical protein